MSGVTPGPGCAISTRARGLKSLPANSITILASSMYFSEWSGDRNSVSAALSKPSPPAPSAGSMALTSICRSSKSRTVAAYSSRFKRRISEGPATGPAAQACRRSAASAHARNCSRSSRDGAGAPFGGISNSRTRLASAIQRRDSVRRLSGWLTVSSRNPPAGALLRWQARQYLSSSA